MHLRPRGPDAFDQADDPVQLAIGLWVKQVVGRVGGPVRVHKLFAALRGGAPKLFCDEGHNRMQQDQALIQDPGERLTGFVGFRRIILQQRL